MKRHYLSNTPTYISWVEMKRRCLDPKRPGFQQYGARGIKVCDRWLAFANFLEDMGLRPVGSTLDRIDGVKGYYKDNCRWATHDEQIRNRSLTRWITFRGETLCMTDWARRFGITPNRIQQRLDEQGWSIEEALTLPVNANRRIRRRAHDATI